MKSHKKSLLIRIAKMCKAICEKFNNSIWKQIIIVCIFAINHVDMLMW